LLLVVLLVVVLVALLVVLLAVLLVLLACGCQSCALVFAGTGAYRSCAGTRIELSVL